MARYRERQTEYVDDDAGPLPPGRPTYVLPVIIAVAVIALLLVLVFGFGFGHSSSGTGGSVHVPTKQAPVGGSGH
jgi:hypothetical protein